MVQPVYGSWQPSTQRLPRQHRTVAPLPAQLLDHCTVCLEEQLYSQAFSLLSSLLVAGIGTGRAAQIPPPQHLALAATLTVHPSYTTRTNSKEKQQASDDALRYLKQAGYLLGSQSSGYDKAFQFSHNAALSRSQRAKTRQSEIASDDDGGGPGRIRSSYVDKDALWSNASDFWSVIGWVFNCSVAHKHRWQRWQLWLDFMLEVLQDDLNQRIHEAANDVESDRMSNAGMVLRGSLLASYMETIGEGRNNKRRVMRAILANGKTKNLAEFGEMWRKETKQPKQRNEKVGRSKKRKLDLERGQYGDYFDEESDADSPSTSLRHSRASTRAPSAKPDLAVSRSESDEGGDEQSRHANPDGASSDFGIEGFGGMESIQLRQRFLALLVRFCSEVPGAFLDVEDLFDLYTEFLKPLSLSVFQQFVLPTTRYLDDNSQKSLSQMLLRPLLAATAPMYNENALTQTDFEVHYAPYTANGSSVVDNAKVGLLIESLLRLLWSAGQLTYSSELQSRVHQGINSRRGKAGFDGRRRVGANVKEEALAVMTLERSAGRMLTLLEMIKSRDATPHASPEGAQVDGAADSPLTELTSSQSIEY